MSSPPAPESENQFASNSASDIASDILNSDSVRVVLDTNVLVAAIRSDRGPSRVLLDGALRKRYRLLVSVPLMFEYEAVLTRQEHLDASGLANGDVQAILDAVAAVAEPVRCAFLWRPTLPDPEDDMVLEVAVNGRADLLVTRNQRDFLVASATFAISVVSPERAVRWLEEQS
jgi:putative PIN family toxin of toxin-antitoxin system